MYAVLFDIDGTLIHTGGAGQLAFAQTFAAEFNVPELSGSVPFAGRSDRAIAADLMHAHGIAPSDENWRRFRGAYLEQLPIALGRREGRVLPGVTELLDSLKSHDHVLCGLLTGNIRDGAYRKLRYYGLSERFAFGGFGDHSKDRCEIAAQARAEAQAFATARNGHTPGPLTGVMVIGDTVHDVTCARAIGAVAVAVPTGGATREQLAAASPDVLVDTLADAAELLAHISLPRREGLGEGFPTPATNK